MAANFAFGTPPPRGARLHSRRATFVTVWEDGYQWYRLQTYPQQRLQHGAGTWNYHGHLSSYRMEFQVSTDGTKQQAVALARSVIQAVHAQPVRPAPRPRLYVLAPTGALRDGQATTFLALNNLRAATQPAVFDLALTGGWQRPKIQAAYSGGACGGDNVPSLKRRTPTVWDLQFGDCDAIELTVTPVGSGFHRLRVHTYAVTVKHDGTVDPGRRTLVPQGGYEWQGRT